MRKCHPTPLPARRDASAPASSSKLSLLSLCCVILAHSHVVRCGLLLSTLELPVTSSCLSQHFSHIVVMASLILCPPTPD